MSRFPDVVASLRRLKSRGVWIPEDIFESDEFLDGQRFWLECMESGIVLPRRIVEKFQKVKDSSEVSTVIFQLCELLQQASVVAFRGTIPVDFIEAYVPGAPTVLITANKIKDKISLRVTVQGTLDSNFPLTSSGVFDIFAILHSFNITHEHCA